MPGKLTYKTLYTQVEDLISRRIGFDSGSKYSTQTSRGVSISPYIGNRTTDIGLADLMETVHTMLKTSLGSKIISGLNVSETDPVSDSITISAGTGYIGATLYELDADVTMKVPFNNTSSVFYVNLYLNRIMIDTSESSDKLNIAKIIVPNPGTTNRVKDNKLDDYEWDAYIVNLRVYNLYGDANGNLEEDSIEFLRDNISPILTDNIIGNLRLNENLKILNTQGTLEINSKEIKIMDTDENTLAKFNENGTFFYDTSGREKAKFTVDEARIGNIIVTTSGIETGNFVSGALGAGFRIEDSGNAEFNNIRARGKITTSVFQKDTISVIGGSNLVMDGDILDADMTTLDSSTMRISGDTTFAVNDILRIKDGTDDEWFTVTNIGSAPIYTVSRDEGGDYSANNNPVWKKGTAVTNFGASGEGGIFMTASESNAPYLSVVTHAGAPWTTLTTRVRLGNLNGFLGYSTDLYGIAIGTTNDYLKYDTTNGLQIKGSITVTGGDAAKTFYQASEPSGEGEKDGDYWVDTDDNNLLYVYDSGSWNAAGAAGGITTFRQSGIPTAVTDGDLWIDTDDNKLYRATNAGDDQITAGEWELQDAAIATGWSHASDATKIDGGDVYAGSSIVIGTGAGAGLLRIGQTDYDTGTGFWVGDDSGTYKLSIGNAAARKLTWDGSALTIDGVVIMQAGSIIEGLDATNVAGWQHGSDATKIDGGDIYTNTVTATQINVANLAAINADLGSVTAGTVTGATLQTASSGSRIVMTANDITAYDGSANVIFFVDTNTNPGDVKIGNYGGGKGLWWDDSAEKFIILGTMEIGSAGKVYIDGTNEIIKVYDASNNLRVELGKFT